MIKQLENDTAITIAYPELTLRTYYLLLLLFTGQSHLSKVAQMTAHNRIQKRTKGKKIRRPIITVHLLL